MDIYKDGYIDYSAFETFLHSTDTSSSSLLTSPQFSAQFSGQSREAVEEYLSNIASAQAKIRRSIPEKYFNEDSA